MSDEIRILLVDDQELIRTGFRLVLLAEPEMTVVGEAGDGRAALAELRASGGACDVVLMDVRMAGMDGIEATAAIVREFPSVRVLVLTTFDLDEYAAAAIRAGASGFLLKDARPTELADAIRRVHSGDAVMAPGVTRRLLERMSNDAAADPWGGPAGGAAAGAPGAPAVRTDALDVLTEREREVFALIAEGRNNAEIGGALFLSESTVKTHVGRILAKLELRDRVHAVILAKDLGV
ncbi:DNA-binding response regulator [Leucobacter sp. OLJS4]|uniref:response regulator transcription factor n=1 Tax=unclassified Leucobacter TaxID=2621730 RepID=UPI000C1775DD|nr:MULTISPECIES: response regulator transcription factor [unclassified Leucobacter]PII85639.1 DNA-binding response regulator [Leucobacter sp. OLCALW19]PII93583.1 DNA-binding response regulator [Leucobacter sp. OLAS13]PII95328.1 DNA-binding response regulator [Leucobacter sp. OLTLW20]PII96103.1 DNA-binding response regulator [Leucobacter sp. OLCS4]PII98927.1 DNA-binding response regulator [Leucobacter sp. OLDS2]